MHKSRIRGGLFAISMATVLALSATAGAGPIEPIDPPPNDDLANAIEVTDSPFAYEGTTNGATLEDGEFEFPWCSLAEQGVWFAYTPEQTGLIILDVNSDSFYAGVAMYKGAPDAGHGDLTPYDCWDSQGGGIADVAGGTTYYFRVSGWHIYDRGVATGDYSFHLAVLDNYLFDNSVELDGLPSASRGINYMDEDSFEEEPRPCGNIGATMWYHYTAEWSGPLVAHTFDVSNDSGKATAIDATTRTDFDTVLAVYEGAADATIDELTLVGCNDDTGQAVSRVDFAATAGTTYWFQVGGFNIDEENYFGKGGPRIITNRWGVYDLTVTATCKGAPATMIGTLGDDLLIGTRNSDVIVGLAGHDVIFGAGSGDIVCGGRGNDTIYGGGGGDRLFGTAGSDILVGGRGNDRLIGGGGFDDADGSRGRDRCRTETKTSCEA